MPPLPVLYSFRRCPYAMRARMGLLVSGVEVEIREVLLRDKPAEMLSASSKGTVPVLVLPDSRVIDESIDIMRWALERNDPEGWLDGDEKMLVARNDGSFKHHLDRYKYSNRHVSDPISHREVATAILADLDARLGTMVYLQGATRKLADMAIFPFIRQFASIDLPWFDAQPWPHLQRWLAGHVKSTLFIQAMVRLVPWHSGDVPARFGPMIN